MNKKKLLATLLSLTMLGSAINIQAMADEYTDTYAEENEKLQIEEIIDNDFTIDEEYDNYYLENNEDNKISLFSYSTEYPNTHTNTGDQAADIVAIAKTQIGYAETGTNHTKYNAWYYGSDTSAAWCAIFISWCANQASATSVIAKNAVASGYNTSNMSSNPYGVPAYAFSNRTPQAGDIVFIDNTGNGTSNHVGLVVDVNSSYIYTVEGNYSNKVSSVTYSRSSGYRNGSSSTRIVFYAAPNYSTTNQQEIGFATNISNGQVLTDTFSIYGTFNKDYGLYPWLELYVDYGYVATTCPNEYSNYAFYLDTTQYSHGEHLIGIKILNQSGLDYTYWYNVCFGDRFTTNIKDGSVLSGIQSIYGFFYDKGTNPFLELYVDYAYALTTCPNQYNNYAFYLDTTQYSEGEHLIGIKMKNEDGLDYTYWYNVVFKLLDNVEYEPLAKIETNNKQYLLFDNCDHLPWDLCKSYCEKIGGYLATITSKDEQEIIENLIDKSNDTTNKLYFLGATDADSEGDWEWVTGEEWSYTNWQDGQPDNTNDENYLNIYYAPLLYKWNDITKSGDSDITGFICEIDILSLDNVEYVAKIETNNKQYLLFDNCDNSSWKPCKLYCEKIGGYLATITSEEEQKTIEKLIESGNDAKNKKYFLGATDEESEGIWEWITGETWFYTNWYTNEPNNDNGEENYLDIYNAEYEYKWNDDNSCPDLTGFICEIDILSSPSPTATPKPTATATATPNPDRTLTGIQIASPVTAATVEGMALNITGLAVEAVYSDGTTETITDYSLSGYDKDKIGVQTITAKYQGFTATFTITVEAKKAVGIVISQKPDKRAYTVGESLDLTGMTVTVMYNNGTSAEVSDYTVSGFDPTTAGTKTITVSYGGFTATFTVTVSENTVSSETAETPKIGILSFIGGKTVTLATATEGAAIYYTTDGSVPTAQSTLYTEPITLTETVTIKAIAIKAGMNSSKTTSGKISVTQVSAPTASHASGQLDAGTVITLKSVTSGAMIYYTTDGSAPTTESTRYNGSIAITSAVTIKAIAVKDGCKSSDVFEISYTVPVKEQGSVIVSAGSVTAAAGDTISVPVYFFADDDITDYRFTMSYDASVFEYASISPAEGVSTSDLFTSVADGEVMVLYSGAAIESGEMCNINLNVLNSAVDGSYTLAISGVSAKCGGESDFEFDVTNGLVELSGSRNSNLDKLSYETVLTDKDGNDVTDKSEIQDEITANVVVDDVRLDETQEQSTMVNIILAVYDRNGALVSLSTMEVDVSDTDYVFTNTVEIPEDVQVGSIKMMVWNSLSDMSPLAAASSLL